MARNPAQIGQHKQLHTLYLAEGAVQFPEFTGHSQILSTNVARCSQSRGELESSTAWWQVSIHGAEAYRQTETELEADALVPLAQEVILNNARQPVHAGVQPGGTSQLVPSPLFAERYSALQARVTFTDQTAIQRVFNVDIGGGATLSFCGDHVGVEVLFPEPGVVIPPNANAQQLAVLTGELPPGIVLDSWIQASAGVAPCAPIGRAAARYTLTRIIENGETFLFEVPPAAKSVSIYPPGDPADFTYVWLIGPLAGAPVAVGAIDSVLVQSGGAAPIPGTARWLAIESDSTTAAVTVVFELEY